MSAERSSSAQPADNHNGSASVQNSASSTQPCSTPPWKPPAYFTQPSSTTSIGPFGGPGAFSTSNSTIGFGGFGVTSSSQNAFSTPQSNTMSEYGRTASLGGFRGFSPSTTGGASTPKPQTSPAKAAKPRLPVQRFPKDEALDIGTSILTIVFGSEPWTQIFTVHERLLTSRSPYFAEKLRAQPTVKSFALPHIHRGTFELYVQLLYTNCLPSKSADEYTALVRLYIMDLGDTVTRTIALEAIHAKAKEYQSMPTNEHVWMLYKGTNGPCGARKLMVDLYTHKATAELVMGKSFPQEFFRDITVRLVARREFIKGRDEGLGGVKEYAEE